MDKIVFADSWESYFADLGLRTFNDFYDYAETTTVNENQKRNVQRLVLGQGPNRHTFFLKRFHSPHLKDMLAARRQFGRLVSQAGVEWRNARHLLDHGIATYQPVCMGQRTRWRLETDSFFITRELDAVCLLDFVVERWRGLDRQGQEKIITAMARLVQTLHKLDIVFPDLYVWHLFLHAEGPPDDCRLSVIDLHRMAQGVRSERPKARDISRLCWSMVPEYFDADHKQFLLDTCLTDVEAARRAALKGVIQRYEATLNKRHTAARYYKKVARLKSA